MSTGMSRIDVSLLRKRLGQRTAISKRFSPSTMLDSACPPRALEITLLTSADHHAPPLALERVDAKFEVRLAANVEHADIFDALDLLQLSFGFGGQDFEPIEVGTDDFDRVVPLDAGEGFHHVVPDVLREIPVDPGEPRFQFLVHRVDQLFLGFGRASGRTTNTASRCSSRSAANRVPDATARNTRCCNSRRYRWRRPDDRAD